jgi:hypothetical protein
MVHLIEILIRNPSALLRHLRQCFKVSMFPKAHFSLLTSHFHLYQLNLPAGSIAINQQ